MTAVPIPQGTMSVEEARRAGTTHVDVYCGGSRPGGRTCGAPLGRYALGVDGGLYGIARKAYGAIRRDGTVTSFVTLGELELHRRRGGSRPTPRSAPGLYREVYNDVEYYRVKCSCGNKDKKRRKEIAKLPVTTRDDGTAALVAF